MNNLTGCKDLLAQLDTLKNLAGDFSAREEQLNTTFRVQSAKERDAFDSQEQEQTAAAAIRQGGEVDGFAEAKEQLQSWFERRLARINRAYNRSRERTQADVSAQDDDCKRRAQQDLIAAERRRDAELAQAAAAHENFQQRLADAEAAFQLLEKSVRSAFGGYGRFRRLLQADNSPADFAGGGNESLDELQRVSGKLNGNLARFRELSLPKFFRFVPVWLAIVVLLGTALAVPVLRHFGNQTLTPPHAVIALAGLAVVLVVYAIGLRAAAPLAKVIAEDFVRARNLLQAGAEKAAVEHQSDLERIEQEFQQRKNETNQEWKRASKEIGRRRYSQPTDLDDRDARLKEKNEYFRHSQLQRLQSAHEEKMARLREEAGEQARKLADARQARLAKLENDFQSGWQKLVSDWQSQVLPLWAAIQSAGATAEKLFPGWLAADWTGWTPPQKFLNAVKFARLDVTTDKFIPHPPKDKRLALPLPPAFSLPLLLAHPQQGSLLFETGKDGGDEAVGTINNIILRLLATTPPGRLEFTIFDPVGLGQNFAALMHLADYEANTINSRIWTQTAQFEEKLAELNEHMEKIIQMYLRNEYATITEYNAQAGSVAEKYHFLVIASFPVNFSETAARRLRNIAANGARCGVFTLIQWDRRNAAPQDFVPDELRKNSACLVRTENGFEFSGGRVAGNGRDARPDAAGGICHATAASDRRRRKKFQPRRGSV